jgi:hypothetical protein
VTAERQLAAGQMNVVLYQGDARGACETNDLRSLAPAAVTAPNSIVASMSAMATGPQTLCSSRVHAPDKSVRRKHVSSSSPLTYTNQLAIGDKVVEQRQHVLPIESSSPPDKLVGDGSSGCHLKH